MNGHELGAHLHRRIQGNPFADNPFQWGQVLAVHTSPNTVDVYLDGASNATNGIRYLSSYTPAVNDVVLVLRCAPTDRVVLGTLA